MSEVITSYSEAQRKYVPEQYKRSEKLLGLIDCDLAMADEIEKALHEIGDSFTLDDAVGPMLDFYGAYAGGFTRRVGETDDQFRARIRIGTGTEDLPTLEAVYNYFELALGITDVGLFPVWPAGLYFVILQGSPDIDAEIRILRISLCTASFFCLALFLEKRSQRSIVSYSHEKYHREICRQGPTEFA